MTTPTPPPAELDLCHNPPTPGAAPCGLARFLVAGYLLCPRCDAAPGVRPTWLPGTMP